MDTGRFDAWTRRRFGLGVSGLAAGLLGVATGGDVAAKKKKKKCPARDTCPANVCCRCNNNTCQVFPSSGNFSTDGDSCTALCASMGAARTGVTSSGTPQSAAYCDIGNACTQINCPIA